MAAHRNRRLRFVKRLWPLLLPLVAAGGCAIQQKQRVSACFPVRGRPASVATAAEQGRPSATLSVLTFNVEGLPWPAKRHRPPRLREIGRELAEMRAKGNAPDVVFLQEAFSTEAARIGARAGYRNYLKGPSSHTPRPPTSENADPGLVDRRKRTRGEWRPIFSSGLYILSDLPLVAVDREPFRSRECAGFDCLSNKGVMHARLAVPGVPAEIDLFNTHLNSRGHAGVSQERSLKAHSLQVDELHRYIEAKWDKAHPLIFGGDLNMRRAPGRFAHFEQVMPYTLVHRYCLRKDSGCEVKMSWDGDAPWLDTEDLQAFESGGGVTVQPIRVEAMFDQPWHGDTLSDHDGFLVTYRLSWRTGALAVPAPAIPVCT
jgi:endonuclease/exonuclease/phosphatase family metal-dependent hydrolase